MSPWIQENRDLPNGRIPLVLESVGGVRKGLHNGVGYRAFRTQEWRTAGKGAGKMKTVSFYFHLNRLKRSTYWKSCLITEGYLILLNYAYEYS